MSCCQVVEGRDDLGGIESRIQRNENGSKFEESVGDSSKFDIIS